MSKLGLFVPWRWKEGTTVLQNIRNHSPNNTASHPRRHESSATLLWELQMLLFKCHHVVVWTV